MAGHSKWKNIRLAKGKADVARASLFGKLSRELTTAAKQGGGSPDSNPRLRLAIEKAKAGSYPAENIKRAIQKGTGELASDNVDEVLYEGYGPGGVAVMVEAATDNRNRTVADIRSIFGKNGGSLGESGSVAWQFERRGQITVAAGASGVAGAAPAPGVMEDALFETALEAGADDVQLEDGNFLIQVAPEQVMELQIELEHAGFIIADLEVSLVPTTTIELEGDAARKMLKLLDALEEYADVVNVSANFEIADDSLGE